MKNYRSYWIQLIRDDAMTQPEGFKRNRTSSSSRVEYYKFRIAGCCRRIRVCTIVSVFIFLSSNFLQILECNSFIRPGWICGYDYYIKSLSILRQFSIDRMTFVFPSHQHRIVRQRRILGLELLDDPSVFRAAFVFFFKELQDRSINLNEFPAVGCFLDLFQDGAGQCPLRSVDFDHTLFDPQLPQEPIRVGVRRQQRGEDGRAAGSQRPPGPPDVQTIA